MGLRDLFGKRPPPAPSVWPRPKHEPGGRAGKFEFFCFATAPIALTDDFSLAPEGYPGARIPPGVGAGYHTPEHAPDEFEAFVHGDFGRGLAEQHPELAPRIAATSFRAHVSGEVPDPPDLGHLQAAWAWVRWFVRRGAFAVYDARADLWHAGDEILRRPVSDRSFACGYRVDVEGWDEPGFGRLVYTSGLAKVGRPDLITAVPPEAAEPAQSLLVAMAQDLVLGRRLPSSGALGQPGGPSMTFEAYAPGVNAPARQHFRNDEVVFVRLG